jgi:hypothetical protein
MTHRVMFYPLADRAFPKSLGKCADWCEIQGHKDRMARLDALSLKMSARNETRSLKPFYKSSQNRQPE